MFNDVDEPMHTKKMWRASSLMAAVICSVDTNNTTVGHHLENSARILWCFSDSKGEMNAEGDGTLHL